MKNILKYIILLSIILGIFSCKKDEEENDDSRLPIPTVQRTPNLNPEVVGYLPSYGMWNIDNIDFSRLTQVLYFSLTPNTDGSLSIHSSAVSNINKIKTAIGNNDVDIIISIGGASQSQNFPEMASTKAKRTKFINALKDFCLDNNLRGADIDWEFPNNATELKNCTSLIFEMSLVFNDNNLLITSAQRANKNDLEDEALKYLDQVHVMAYDNGFAHSTYDYAVSCVNHFLNRGVPRSKIVLGLPFYGRTSTGGENTYRAIHNAHNTKPEDDVADIYYFNGPDMISKKTKYAITEALMGVMIWEISQDTNDDSSLLKAIDDTKNSPL